MIKTMSCPKCNQLMTCLGNVSGLIYTSIPPQWDVVWVCHHCKIKKTVRESGKLLDPAPDLSDYKEENA